MSDEEWKAAMARGRERHLREQRERDALAKVRMAFDMDRVRVSRPLGKRVKHPDRRLPVWGLILEAMEDGLWYSRPALREALARHGVSYDSVKAALQQKCWQKGFVRRDFDPGFNPHQAMRLRTLQYVYQIKDEGREALSAVRAKYGVAEK